MQGQYPPADEWIAKFGSLPLVAHPGELWLYHNSLDVLGLLVARVSGKMLGTFMRERLFEPLGMKDTAFQLPADKIDRLPIFYVFNRDTNILEPFDNPTDSDWTHDPPFEAGGGGLLSTADDYLAFSRMLLNKGRHGREQILSRATVELMTSDHLTPDQRRGTDIFLGAHSGWGFGMAVAIKREEIYQTPGRFGWDGGFGTSAYTDPAEGLIGILLTQRLVDSPEPSKIYTDFWTTAYAAME